MTNFRLTDQYHGGTAAGLRPRRVLADRLSQIEPQSPRPLTTEELQRLHRLGFDTLARQLAAGTCEHCGMNKLGTGHQQMCVEREQECNPLPARPAPLQPWDPRPVSRRLRDAA